MGLINNASVCFANAIVQALAVCYGTVCEYADPDNAYPMWVHLRDLLSRELTDDVAGDVRELVMEVARLHPRSIFWGQQNDAGEFLIMLMEDVCENHPALRPCFFGKTQLVTRCGNRTCRDRAVTRDDLGIITLCADEDTSSLSGLFVKAFDRESVVRTCEKCSAKTARRSAEITALPRLMVTYVNYTKRVRLDVKPLLMLKTSASSPAIYELKGVILYKNHHYRAAVKNATAQHYMCDDMDVRKISQQKFLDVACESPYMLFFVRNK